jgi:hypothetical protein
MNDDNMIRRVAPLLLGGVLGGLAVLASCAKAPMTATEPAPEAKTFVYGNHEGSVSRVERSVGADGRETLHGETEIAGAGNVGRVVEEVSLDASGSLVSAEIAVYSRCSEQADKRVRIDRARGLVEVQTAGGVERWRVANDAPWALAPVADAMGRTMATPVSAWITLRAASAGTVRVIDTDRRWTYRTPADQLAVPTDEGTTVVLGGDGVDANREFIETLRLNGAGVVLSRIAEPSPTPELACGSFGRPGVSRLQ